MFSTAARVRLSPVLLAVALAAGSSLSGAAAQAQDASLFRIFLVDGDSLVSYGEFARVADKVVFPVPLGDSVTPVLHMVTIPANLVDWTRTDEYANAVRAKRYAETRGEEDFTLLASRVTQALNDINLTTDPRRRLAMAEEARRNLAAWPAANFGYRAEDVARLVSMLDDVVTEMRAAAGDRSFALSLVATTVPPPPVELLPPPDTRGSLESAFRAAMTSVDSEERLALLRSVSSTLSRLPDLGNANGLRSRVDGALEAELQIEHAYEDLARAALREAEQRARRGDARGLQQLIARALAGDDRLGGRRPGHMSVLLATLDLRLDEANRVRVAREAWAARVETFRAYRRATQSPRAAMRDLMRDLRAIRDRQGTSTRALQRTEVRATIAIHELRIVKVPPELAAMHNLLITALQLTRQAASVRRDAISSKNTTLAWDASSAAAGALMLAERAEDELNRLIADNPPVSR